jgi:hypothetical protein
MYTKIMAMQEEIETMANAPLVWRADPRAKLPTRETYELNADALAGVALVRRYGLSDMYDRERVIHLLGRMGFDHGAAWLRANRHLYFMVLESAATK